jgi:hypothetical protein
MILLRGNLMSEKNHTTMSDEALSKYFLVRYALSDYIHEAIAISEIEQLEDGTYKVMDYESNSQTAFYQ